MRYFQLLFVLTITLLPVAVLVSQTKAEGGAPGPSPGLPTAPMIAPQSGHLSLAVVIVDDLSPKPVPLTDFVVTCDALKSSQTLRTDEAGKLESDLPPGHYHITSCKPTTFKGRSYIWTKDFEILTSGTVKIELTDSDATSAEVRVSHHVAEEAQVYNALKSGVVTVEGDFGQGSGFVVDSSGLIVTNQHVVNGGRWAAVRFDKGIRVPAVIVEQDSAADVAIIAINPATYGKFAVLPLADPTEVPLAVEGEKVLAIGSPLGQEKVLTTGIVSKVEKDYLISDVNVNHGNSGGPLLNLDGKVIGITTFIDPGGNGPGISGIISITKAIPVLARARSKMATVTLPNTEMLPDVSTIPIPEESLTAVKINDCKPEIVGGPKNFQTVIQTPFYLAALQSEFEAGLSDEKKRRVSKRNDKTGVKDEMQTSPGHFWLRYALHEADPVVAVLCRPALKEKSSSVWAGVLGAMAGVPTQRHMEFRDDFWDMALYRGDTLVHPVRRQRDNVTALYADLNIAVNDTATGGIYFYDPSAFQPGQSLILYVRRESDLTRWDTVKIGSDTQEKIWKMFLPYRVALGDSQSHPIVGLSSYVHEAPHPGAESSNTEIMSRYVGAAVTPTLETPKPAVPRATITVPNPAPITVAPKPQPAAGADVSKKLGADVTPTPTVLVPIQPMSHVFTLKDGSKWTGPIDHQDDQFLFVTIPTGTKLLRKDQVVSVEPPL